MHPLRQACNLNAVNVIFCMKPFVPLKTDYVFNASEIQLTKGCADIIRRIALRNAEDCVASNGQQSSNARHKELKCSARPAEPTNECIDSVSDNISAI
ncbi:hypothetical protein M514_05529 [Trichuris suis]|uniref:Uncharacterized protein n=1 Tax=Trichuris suis TaxID=68888 RepID=A0A085MZG3_9BILA|nr:hypothetical protein M513_05529 [Trichuris suis]KFD62609.1 hypothetical protein M514_05529 [Trichuris suis]